MCTVRKYMPNYIVTDKFPISKIIYSSGDNLTTTINIGKYSVRLLTCRYSHISFSLSKSASSFWTLRGKVVWFTSVVNQYTASNVIGMIILNMEIVDRYRCFKYLVLNLLNNYILAVDQNQYIAGTELCRRCPSSNGWLLPCLGCNPPSAQRSRF